MNTTKKQSYTAATLAAEAGVSRVYIAKLCRDGKLDCERIGSIWLIHHDEAQRWLEQRAKKEVDI
jgi:excisionase family DNA binding protein